MRATNGRHYKPSNGVPYTRIMAAFILATLISALFALPAYAAAGDLTVTTTSSVPKVLPSGLFSYTVTFTNASGADVTAFSFLNTVTGGGTVTAATPSAGTICPAPAAAMTCTTATFTTGTSVVVTFNVTAPTPAPATVTDTVSAVVGTGLGVVTGSLVATTTVENADLVVTKSHTGATTPGGALTYTITVRNNGPDPAAGVTLHDAAPAGITFGTVTVVSSPVAGGPAACSAAAASLIDCASWSIPVGTTVTVTVPATLSATATVGSSIANTASITPPATSLDANLLNNTVTDSFVVGSPNVDLGVTLTVLPTTAAPGGTVTYTVTVTNPDVTTDATNVVVADTLPAGLTAVVPPTAPTAGTAAVANNTWTWTIPTVAKATAVATPTTVTASFDATVDAPTTLTTITNTATLTATQTDPVTTNNTASADLTISSLVADLNVLTSVSDSKPNQGDTITLDIQVSNAGPADASNVVVKDVLPTGLKYVSCTCVPTGLRRASSHLYLLPPIPASSAASVTLTVTVQASSGTLQNTASIVSSDQTDPTAANNSDALSITIGGVANNPGGPTGSTGSTGGTGGTTAFTGFTAGQMMPWFMLLFSLGLVAVEWSRRMRLVSPIGTTYGFDPFQL